MRGDSDVDGLKRLTLIALKALSVVVFIGVVWFLLAFVALAWPDEFDEGPFNWTRFFITGALIAAFGFGAACVLRLMGRHLQRSGTTTDKTHH